VTALSFQVTPRGGDEEAFTVAALARAAQLCRDRRLDAALGTGSWALSCCGGLQRDVERWPEFEAADKSWNRLMHVSLGRRPPVAMVARLDDRFAERLDALASRVRCGADVVDLDVRRAVGGGSW
jgi:hypothetical protein